MRKRIFVTGIGTDVGKTIVSAMLVSGMKADYWKPVQAGDLQHSDSVVVSALSGQTIHPERFRLTKPMSPHAAAHIDGVEISLDAIEIPQTANTLIIEGAGGLYVPLSQDILVLDLAKKCSASVIVVSKHYLGSINHTLLTISALKTNDIPILGIIFNGDENHETEKIISHYAQVPILGRIPVAEVVSPEWIAEHGAVLAQTIKGRL